VGGWGIFWKAKDSQILVFFEHKSGVGPVDWSSNDKSLHMYWWWGQCRRGLSQIFSLVEDIKTWVSGITKQMEQFGAKVW